MPAKSKDQQKAAGIALQAKREGTVDELPKNSASHQMATSMSEEELKDFAETKRKGLPKDISDKNESKAWAGSSLVEVFKEEMKDTDEEDEQITTQKSKVDRIEDREESSDDGSYADSWYSITPGVASHSRHPLSTNTTGARAAVRGAMSERSFETEWEEDEYYDPPEDAIARSEIAAEDLREVESKIIKNVIDNLKLESDEADVDEAIGYAIDEIFDLGSFSPEAQALYDAYGDEVSSDTPENVWALRVLDVAAKDLGERAWEKFKGRSDKNFETVDEDCCPEGESITEKSPEGWEGTVETMKDEEEIDNPWALAHWMKDKGYESHKESVDPNSLDLIFEEENISEQAAETYDFSGEKYHMGTEDEQTGAAMGGGDADDEGDDDGDMDESVNEQGMVGGAGRNFNQPGHMGKANEAGDEELRLAKLEESRLKELAFGSSKLR